MGLIEEKIKDELRQIVYADSIKIYEFIESRFALDEAKKDEIIRKLNQLNEDLAVILKDSKLA